MEGQEIMIKQFFPTIVLGWFLCMDGQHAAWIIPTPYETEQDCQKAGNVLKNYGYKWYACIPGPSSLKELEQ